MSKLQIGLRLAIIILLMLGSGITQAQKGKKPPKDPPPPIVEYEVRLLETPADYASTAFGINDAGEIAGRIDPGDINNQVAVYWNAAGELIDMNAVAEIPEGYVLRSARSINASGQIAGRTRYLNTGPIRAFRYDPPTESAPATVTILNNGGIDDLRVPNGNSINESGEVVIATYNSDGPALTLVIDTTNSVVSVMDGLGFAINDSSDVAGTIPLSYEIGFQENAYDASTREELPGLDILDNNNLGDLTGYGRVPRPKGNKYDNDPFRLTSDFGLEFLIDSAGHIRASSINDDQDAVGVYTHYDRVAITNKLFLYTNEEGLIADVDDLVVYGSSDDLTAWATRESIPLSDGVIRSVVINNRDASGFGQIAGTVILADGTDRAFVLTPVLP